MKRLSFENVSLTPKQGPQSEYEELVNQTAKILGEPYIVVHKMVEKWPLSKIRDRLHEATHHCGRLTPRIYWFWKRKMDRMV